MCSSLKYFVDLKLVIITIIIYSTCLYSWLMFRMRIHHWFQRPTLIHCTILHVSKTSFLNINIKTLFAFEKKTSQSQNFTVEVELHSGIWTSQSKEAKKHCSIDWLVHILGFKCLVPRKQANYACFLGTRYDCLSKL